MITKYRDTGISNKSLIQSLRHKCERNDGLTPTREQARKDHMTYNPRIFEGRFGSWKKSCIAAGLEPNKSGEYGNRGYNQKYDLR